MEQLSLDTERHSVRIAIIISSVMNPLFIAMPIFFIVSLVSAPTPWQGILWWGVTALGISLAPLLFVLDGVRRGRFTDRHVSQREQRLIPLLFGIFCVFAVFCILLALHTSRLLLATLIALISTLIIATLITRYWKISFHLIGIAGALTILFILFGPIMLALSPLIIIIAWARWWVQAHTPLQACAGILLAILITTLVFWLAGLLPA